MRKPFPESLRSGSSINIYNDRFTSIPLFYLKYRNKFIGSVFYKEIKNFLEKRFDVVMSDMAVNTTGIKNIDSIQTGELCKEAMIF